MQIKSSSSLHGAALNDVKELLSLVGDAKKAKEQIDLLSQDIAAFKELYQKNQEEVEKVSALKADVDIKISILKEQELKVSAEKSELSKKVAAINNKDLEVSLLEKKLNQAKAEFESEYALKIQGVEAMRANAEKQKAAAEFAKKEAEAIKAEFEEKLSKLKAMVG